MRSTAVWAWLPGRPAPVRAGTLALDQRYATFAYDETYLAAREAVALDPVHLPLMRAQPGAGPARQAGLFGVFRDMLPEGFGLAQRVPRPDDPLALLEAAPGDAVGALAVGDDGARQAAFAAPPSERLLAALEDLPPQAPSARAAADRSLVEGTGLGGARPKLTVLHQGQLWVAKLQKRGDPAHTPLREHLAMASARAAGLRVAPTLLLHAGERQVLLVRRFDRKIDGEGRVSRRFYASARTVLGRSAGAPRSGGARSYVALALQLRRWCGIDGHDAREEQRELFRRMVFNAICGNGDDHPRNHGLVRRRSGWRLAPAFDIVPCPAYAGLQAMALDRAGRREAGVDALVGDCEVFGYDRADALAFIEHATQALRDTWPRLAREAGWSARDLPPPEPAWLRRGPAQAVRAPAQGELALAFR
jgi:serine/threonine-protein kinase HipA